MKPMNNTSPRVEHYRALLDRYPQPDDSVPREEHLCYLEALCDRRRYAGAYRFLREVCIPALEKEDDTSDLPQFLCYLGQMAWRLKRIDEAERVFREAMRLASWDTYTSSRAIGRRQPDTWERP